MPPKIPQSLVAAISPALVFLFFLPSPAQAQLGYAELQAEQGSNLTPSSGSRLVYIPEESTAWRYWTGDLGAPGAPGSDWRSSSFVEPSGWLTGQTSVGYGDTDDNTELTTMQGNYTSVYLRHQFTIPSGGIPALLHLRLYVDDAAIIWINGIEIARANITTPAPGNTDTATTSVNNASWQDFFIPGTGGTVVEGINTVAIHGLNIVANSSDFSIDIELARPRLDFGQIEGSSNESYLPQNSPNSSPPIGFEFQGGGDLANKTFEIRSIANGVNFAASSHAYNVGTYSYRGVSKPGNFLTHVTNWNAEGYLGSEFLNSGTTPPDAGYSQVQNHSWISTDEDFTDLELNRYIRRFDYANARDGVLCAVGLNNGSASAVPQIWGCSYNSISVGVLDGRHSRGGTVAGVDGPGRIKPDIVSVGNNFFTSYATANVSGAAAFLLGEAYGRPELSGVFHPEVNKAIMMASAEKNSSWSHSSSQPLDLIYGAGTLNLYDAYHLLHAGQHLASAGLAPLSGWDFAELDPATTADYTFFVADGMISDRCSVILTWFRQFEDDPSANNFASLPTLPDFEMRLYESQNGVVGTQVELSDSAIDNVEHVYFQDLPAGEYTIRVATDTTSNYAIAWENRVRLLPEVAVNSVDPGGGNLSFGLENLVVGETYTLQFSIDLTNWSNLYTVTAGSDSETFTQMAVPVDQTRGFYRIVWAQ